MTNKPDRSLLKGYFAAIVARWVIATLAGLVWVAAGSTAWKGWAPLPYSMAYNGTYIFAEGIVTAVIISTPPVRKGLEYVRKQALG